jgi:urea ABC transporter ATP-binding protein UrtE
MLVVTDICVRYGRTPVLNDINLIVESGEIVSIIGRNGVGKTTLMKAIIGLLRVQSGRVTFNSEDITKLAAHVRARHGIGYVPQGRMIFSDLTVEENLLVGADLNHSRSKELLEGVLQDFPRLRERYKQRGGTLSGGEQQMLALGRALVGGSKLLLLDEPSAGIQPSIVQELEARIASINNSRGLAILLVEQNIEFAAALSRRVYILQKGRIAREISSKDVMNEDIVRSYLAI